jgi:redox-sensitive bicupin YhaK (pirin superfamily)
MPERHGIQPSYEEKKIAREEARGKLLPVASPQPVNGEVTIHQDAQVYASILDKDESVTHALAAGRGAWIQVARGSVEVNGQKLGQGDGAAITDESEIKLTGTTPGSELLLFDLA